MDTLMSDTKTIKNGLYTILENNHFKHTNTLQRLIEERNNILHFTEQTYSKKTEFDKHLDEAHYLLEAINIPEQTLLKKIRALGNKQSSTSALSIDIENSRQMSTLENKLKDVQQIKQNIMQCIFSLNTEKENIILTVDKIMFDNNVMIDRVLKNFIEFEKLFDKYKL
jgi:RNase adaptor protein for sRNA GlmZ degradation